MYENNQNNYSGNAQPNYGGYSQNSGQFNQTYQNMYSMFGGYNPVADREAAEIRKYGMRAGGVILATCFLQYAGIIAMRILGVYRLFATNAYYLNGLGALFQLFYLFIPFLVLFLTSSSEDRGRIMIYGKPKSTELYVFAVFAGLMVCTVANYADTLLLSAFSAAGVDFISGAENNPIPSDAVGSIMMTLNIAVIPALIEEFAFRGVLLQPLRKYGDKFAIIVTSVAFALMHGNMTQIPFAFAVGLALGYFCIATDSIWTSVTIHFLNNLSSVILSVYFERNPDGNPYAYIIVSAAMFIIGIIALVLFIKNNDAKLFKKDSELSASMQRGLYLCAPTLVAVVIYYTYTTITLQTTSHALGMIVLIALNAVLCAYFVKNILAVRHDKRLANTNAFVISMVFTLIWAFLGTLFIITSTFVSLSGASVIS